RAGATDRSGSRSIARNRCTAGASRPWPPGSRTCPRPDATPTRRRESDTGRGSRMWRRVLACAVITTAVAAAAPPAQARRRVRLAPRSAPRRPVLLHEPDRVAPGGAGLFLALHGGGHQRRGDGADHLARR